MSPFRYLFPSFEKPVERPRYLNIEPQRRGRGGRVAAMAGLGMACAIAVTWALPDGSPISEPQAQLAAAVPTKPPAIPAVNTPKPAETLAMAVSDKQSVPTVKLFTLCSQRATARRDCAIAKAAKERLLAPEAFAQAKPAPAMPSAAGKTQSIARAPAAAPAAPETLAALETGPDASATVSPPAAAAKSKKVVRVQNDAPVVDRLVRVQDQLLPDGRRISVYRRANGSFETGTVIEGEFRSAAPSRRANLEPEGHRFFGLQ